VTGSGVRSARPPVSAIVCTRGRAALLDDCLKSLAIALQEGDELIVVESGAGGAAEALEGLGPVAPRTIHIHVERPGKSHQLNLGIGAAQADVILLTDDDVRVEPSWASEMALSLTDPKVGIACGRVRGLSMAPGWDRPHEVPDGEAPYETWTFAHGAAMAVRTVAAWHAGGFDERLGPGAPAVGEDHDFLLRVRQRGWRIVVASAAPVQHLDWRTEAENRRNAMGYERGAGAVVGAAIRRAPREGVRLLRHRVGYQRRLLDANRPFGLRALVAFAGGLAYGIRLPERDRLRPP